MAFSSRRVGDLDEDPFFRHPGPPMGLGGFGFGPFFGPPQHTMLPAPMMGPSSSAVAPFGAMWPFGGGSPFALMNPMFSMENMMNQAQRGAAVPGAHSYSSSTVMHYSSMGGEGSSPRIYQASTSTRRAPGGIMETQKSVKDSQTGIHKMAIGHHIGDRSHTVEKRSNAKTKEREEHQEFVNIDETDAHGFNTEWEERTRPVNQAFHTHGHHAAIAHGRRQAEVRGLPAASDIGPSTVSASTKPNTNAKQAHGKRKNRPASLSHEDDIGNAPGNSQEASQSHHHEGRRHKQARFQSPPEDHHPHHSSHSHAHSHSRRYHSPPPPGGEAGSRPPQRLPGTGLHASGSGATKKNKRPIYVEL